MANAVYPKFKELALGAGGNLSAGTVKATLIDTANYTYSAAHQYYSSVGGSARVGTAVTLGSKTLTDGVFDAADISFTGLSSAPTIEALIIWVDSGVEATSPLVAYIDTATGLPVSAGATQVDVAFDAGANKIFKL